MHTEKQVKDTPSRMFQQMEGKGTQQFRFEDNRGNVVPMLDNRPSSVFQAKWMNNISCIQRHLPDGVTYGGNTAKVWLGNINVPEEKSDGIMCKEINLGESKNKAEALKNISTKAGEVGTKATTNYWAIKDTDDDKYNNQDSTKLNPFQVPIKTTIYPIGEDDVSAIKLYYHYGPFNYGYIISVVLDNGAEVGEMTNKKPTGNQYSNVHDTKDGKKIIDQTNDQTSNKKYDAYVKLAGEGARFQCVRRNIDMISNNTVICVPCWTEGVAFCEFWKTWGETFGKKFNIKDDDVITKIMEKGNKLIMEQDISTTKGSKKSTTTQPKKVGSDNIELEPSDNLIDTQFNITKNNIIEYFIANITDGPKQECFKTKIEDIKSKDTTFQSFQTDVLNIKKREKRNVLVKIFDANKEELIKKIIKQILWKQSPTPVEL